MNMVARLRDSGQLQLLCHDRHGVRVAMAGVNLRATLWKGGVAQKICALQRTTRNSDRPSRSTRKATGGIAAASAAVSSMTFVTDARLTPVTMSSGRKPCRAAAEPGVT